MRIWQKEKPVHQAWVEMTGKTPDGYFQGMPQQFPKSGMNESARQLEELTTRLGMFNAMPNRLYGGERRGATLPFGTADIPGYVLNQLRRPNNDIDAPPEETQDFLRKH